MHLKIVNTLDGSQTLLVEEMGEHYHSTFGAIDESKHVYIKNGLIPVIQSNLLTNVLEVGFGTGLNAFLSFIESFKQKKKIIYSTIEPFPIDNTLIKQLNYPKLIDNSNFCDIYQKIHICEWDKTIILSELFSIFKVKNKIQEVDLSDNSYDVVYYDAFAPDFQPELWTFEIFCKIYKAMKPNSVLMTYCAKGNVKRTLKSLGFSVQGVKGPAGKREITKAIKL